MTFASRRNAVVIALLAALSLCGSAAEAARPIVVVAPFRGPRAIEPQNAVLRGLRRVATVLSPARYQAVARGIVAETQSADDLAAVAHELGARWIVTGTLAHERAHWALGISLRDGNTGHVRSRLRYNISSPRCPPTLLRTLTVEIGEALADAQQSPAPPENGELPPERPTKQRGKVVPVGDDDEAPPKGPGDTTKQKKKPVVVQQAEQQPAPQPEPEPPAPVVKPKPEPKPATPTGTRPRWAHWFELGVGASLSGRNFSTSPAPPKFSSSVVGGLHADFVLFPLAFTWNRAYGLFSGLGLFVALDKPFWPNSTATSAMNMQFATSELRLEGGLHWKFTLYKPMPRPQLTLIVTGGVHEFAFQRGAGGVDLVGVPDVQYVYLSIGGALTLHFADWAWVHAQFLYHVVTNFGPIEAPSEYGLAAGYGLRFSGGIDFLVWKGLRVGAQGFYEHFAIQFGYDRNNEAKIADTASDEYYGGMLILGYVY